MCQGLGIQGQQDSGPEACEKAAGTKMALHLRYGGAQPREQAILCEWEQVSLLLVINLKGDRAYSLLGMHPSLQAWE